MAKFSKEGFRLWQVWQRTEKPETQSQLADWIIDALVWEEGDSPLLTHLYSALKSAHGSPP